MASHRPPRRPSPGYCRSRRSVTQRHRDATVNGTNFKNGAVVNIAGVPYPTQYNSPTQLMVLNAPKRTSAGNTAITVRVGATTTAATNWVFS